MGLAKFMDQLGHIGIAQGGSFGAYALSARKLLAVLRIPAACRLKPRELHRLALRSINQLAKAALSLY